MIIKLDSNGNPSGYPIPENNFRQMFPNVSFPLTLTPADAQRFGYGMYEFSQKPETTERYKKVVEVLPERDLEGYWRQKWSIVDQTDEEKSQVDHNESIKLRYVRNCKLNESDWTRLDDIGLSLQKKNEWAEYRQKLRDITQQEGFPFSVIWPTPPA